MSSGELFSCCLSQEAREFHVSVIDPCCSSAAWWHAAVQSSANICPSYEEKKWISLLPLPTCQCLLVYTVLDWGQGMHPSICVLAASLWSAWLNHANGHPALGTGRAAPRHWHLDPAAGKQSPRVLLLQSCSWPAKGDLLTWPSSYRVGDVQQEWPEVFQQALGSEGTVWRLANKVT